MFGNAWLEKEQIRVGHLMFGDEVDLIVEIEVLQKTLIGVELVLRQGDGRPVAFAPSGLLHDFRSRSHARSPQLCGRDARCHLRVLAVGPYSIDLALAESGIRLLDYVESGVKFHMDSAAFGSRHWGFFQNRGQGHALWDVKFELLERVVHNTEAMSSAVGISLER